MPLPRGDPRPLAEDEQTAGKGLAELERAEHPDGAFSPAGRVVFVGPLKSGVHVVLHEGPCD